MRPDQLMTVMDMSTSVPPSSQLPRQAYACAMAVVLHRFAAENARSEDSSRALRVLNLGNHMLIGTLDNSPYPLWLASSLLPRPIARPTNPFLLPPTRIGKPAKICSAPTVPCAEV